MGSVTNAPPKGAEVQAERIIGQTGRSSEFGTLTVHTSPILQSGTCRGTTAQGIILDQWNEGVFLFSTRVWRHAPSPSSCPPVGRISSNQFSRLSKRLAACSPLFGYGGCTLYKHAATFPPVVPQACLVHRVGNPRIKIAFFLVVSFRVPPRRCMRRMSEFQLKRFTPLRPTPFLLRRATQLSSDESSPGEAEIRPHRPPASTRVTLGE